MNSKPLNYDLRADVELVKNDGKEGRGGGGRIIVRGLDGAAVRSHQNGSTSFTFRSLDASAPAWTLL